MGAKFNLVYDSHPVLALAPAADSAGRSGAWVDLNNAHKLYIVVDIAQGAATGMPLTFQQAKDVSGTGAKGLSGNLNVWANQAEASGDALVQQAAAQSFTTSTATGNKKIVFEAILESILDTTNGFKTLQVITGASASGNVSAANYFLIPGRFNQQLPPSAIV